MLFSDLENETYCRNCVSVWSLHMCVSVSACVLPIYCERYRPLQITFDFSRLAGCLVMSTDNLIPQMALCDLLYLIHWMKRHCGNKSESGNLPRQTDGHTNRRTRRECINAIKSNRFLRQMGRTHTHTGMIQQEIQHGYNKLIENASQHVASQTVKSALDIYH